MMQKLNINFAIGCIAVVLILFMFKGPLLDLMGSKDDPKPVPAATIGIAELMGDSADARKDADYIGRLFGQLGEYVYTESGKIATTNDLFETAVYSVGTWGAIGQGWKIKERYPKLNDKFKALFAEFEQSGPLTDAQRKRFAEICAAIQTEAVEHGK